MAYKVIKKVKGELQTLHLSELGFYCKYGFDEGKMLLLFVSLDKKDSFRLTVDKESINSICNTVVGHEIVPRINMNLVFKNWINHQGLIEYNEYLDTYNPNEVEDYSIEFEEIEDKS